MNRIVLFLCVILSLNVAFVVVHGKKKDYNSPHPHRGNLKAYEPGPFSSIKLTKKDESVLASGKAVMKQDLPKKGDKDATGGGAVCVQDVAAPIAAVWNQILDLDTYTTKVPKVGLCKNYMVKKNGDGSSTIKTRMIMNILPGYKYQNHYDHLYAPKKNSMVWKLDYDKTSDFDDVSGHWHVEDHPTKDGWTRVFYACDVKMKAAVPGPVMNFIGKAALRQATSWVKKESEQKPEGTIPTQYAPAGWGLAKQ